MLMLLWILIQQANTVLNQELRLVLRPVLALEHKEELLYRQDVFQDLEFLNPDLDM